MPYFTHAYATEDVLWIQTNRLSGGQFYILEEYGISLENWNWPPSYDSEAAMEGNYPQGA